MNDENFDENNEDSYESYGDHGSQDTNIVQKFLLLFLSFDFCIDLFLCFFSFDLENKICFMILWHGLAKSYCDLHLHPSLAVWGQHCQIIGGTIPRTVP